MKKKIFALLFVALFITSCATVQEEIIPEFEQIDLSVKNFDGKEYIIAQDNTNDIGNLFFYSKDSLYYDLLLAHINKIEKQHNVQLKIITSLGIGSGIQNNLFTSLVSDIKMCDFVYFGSDNANMRAAQAGTLYPLNELPDIIDLSDSEKYGPINILECCMAKGNVYGVIPNNWPQKSNDGNVSTLFVINETLIQKYGLEDPRDFYEQNTWNLSKLEEITPLFHVEDGDKDIKAFLGHSAAFARGFSGAYKLTPIYEKDGELLPVTSNPTLITAIEWAREYITKYADDFTFLSRWDAWKDLSNGDCVMALGETMNIIEIAKEMENFGIVPFPVADQYDCKDIGMTYSTMTTMSIFSGVESPEECASIIDILFEDIEGVSKDDHVESLYKTLFFDKRDTELYVSLYKNAVYDYYGIGGTSLQTIEGLYQTKTGQEIVSSLEGVMDEQMEVNIIPNYLAMQEYNK